MGQVLVQTMSELPVFDLPIIHLIHSSGFYGAERVLFDHCRLMPGQHQVVFIDAPPALIERFRQAQIECRNCNGLLALLKLLQGRSMLLNAHNFKAQVFALLCAWRLHLPLIWTQHGFTPRSTKQKFYTWLSLRLCRSRKVHRVVCVAQSIARLHQQTGVKPEKLQVIPNGLPEQHAPGENLRDPLAPLVGFVGRLSQEKGPDLFLDALIPLCRQRPDLKAVLLGDGPMKEALYQRIKDAGLQLQILMPGYQNNMHSWVKRLNVLVLSSRTEGTPMILLEAMQAGTPVTAFAVGGIPDMIEHRTHGLLAQPLDSTALAGHVAELLDSPALALGLSQAARNLQREHYHLPQLAQHWQTLYRAACKVVTR